MSSDKLFQEAKAMQEVFNCSFERALVMASERNPELTEPVAVAKKKVYQIDRTGSPGEGDQSEHNPALTKGPGMPSDSTLDPEKRAQQLADYAYAIKREKGWDFFRAWNQAVSEHPELVNSDADGGPSRSAKVPETNVLPDSGANAVEARYTEISPVVRFR
jgi:hypothetical protein